MPRYPETRLCERCWSPIPASAPCRIGRHPDPRHPLLAEPRSFRHLAGDPACTGSQYFDVEVFRGEARS